MSGRYIIWLRDFDQSARNLVGGKASNLAELYRAGLPGPDGFCILTTAYHAWSEQELEETELPEGLTGEVQAAYADLERRYGPGVRVAVRSSATNEDAADASFAGQYLTTLNQTGSEQILKAMVSCWKSAQSREVRSYQAKRAASKAAMGVLVQVMLDPEAAGVLFTQDPSNQRSRYWVIETVAKRSDGVVSGEMTPARFEFDPHSGSFCMTQESNAFQDTKIPWGKLAQMGKRIEQIKGCPQDIEWVYRDGQFYLLQSRPITQVQKGEPLQVWSRANVGEIFPGVVTPLTWSIFRRVYALAGQSITRSFLTLHWNWTYPSGDWPESPCLVNGYMYMELASVYASFAGYPGVKTNTLEELLGFEFHWLSEADLPRRRPRYHIMDPYRWGRFWIEMGGITHGLEKTEKRLRHKKNWNRLDVHTHLNERMAQIFQEIDQLMAETGRALASHVQCTRYAFSAYGLIAGRVLDALGADEAAAFTTQLTSDYQNMTTARQIEAIWILARQIEKNPRAREILLKQSPPGQVISGWKNCSECGEVFVSWLDFLKHYGDRSEEEFELSRPHWEENPDLVIETMRDILRHDLPNPRNRLASCSLHGQRQALDVLQRVNRKGRWIDKVFLSLLYRRYIELVPLRENLKLQVVRRFSHLRKLFLQLSDDLVSRGILNNRDDIFYLSYDEIQSFLEQFPSERLEFIEQRQAESQLARRKSIRSVIRMRGKAVLPDVVEGADTTTLKGIHCSGGVVTAPAYKLDQNGYPVEGIPNGCILVTHHIDPGLTPLFLNAVGLVTEVGGMLSHGATLAREYGIPAVVSVAGAMQRIQQGQIISLDGFSGQVIIHGSARE